MEKELLELKRICQTPAFSQISRGEIARAWRNETSASWIDNLAARLPVSVDSLISSSRLDQKTGQPHTVESMVAELRERVKLDSIHKKIAEPDGMLFTSFQISSQLEAPNGPTQEEIELVISNFVTSHLGFVSKPSVLHALRERFGQSELLEFATWIDAKIEEVRDANPPNARTDRASGEGQPLKLDHSSDSNQPLFENVHGV